MPTDLQKRVPIGFDHPIADPQSDEQARLWQEINRAWWETRPMRYDWRQPVAGREFTRAFYDEIDRRLFDDVWQFMPWTREPFDAIVDFGTLGHLDVLEIGIGCGTHAELLARHARSFTGIDLTSYAVTATLQRLRLRNDVNATILQMDAEEMEFADRSFDLVWGWGVIHHSGDTRRALQEIWRVLRPGGRAILMVYHRNWWNYYMMAGLLRGVFAGDLLKTRSAHKSLQRITDGAFARYYSPDEWRRLVSRWFEVERIAVYGSKSDLIPLPGGRLKTRIMNIIPNAWSRVLTNTFRLGGFLVSHLRKPLSRPAA